MLANSCSDKLNNIYTQVYVYVDVFLDSHVDVDVYGCSYGYSYVHCYVHGYITFTFSFTTTGCCGQRRPFRRSHLTLSRGRQHSPVCAAARATCSLHFHWREHTWPVVKRGKNAGGSAAAGGTGVALGGLPERGCATQPRRLQAAGAAAAAARPICPRLLARLPQQLRDTIFYAGIGLAALGHPVTTMGGGPKFWVALNHAALNHGDMRM